MKSVALFKMLLAVEAFLLDITDLSPGATKRGRLAWNTRAGSCYM